MLRRTDKFNCEPISNSGIGLTSDDNNRGRGPGLSAPIATVHAVKNRIELTRFSR